MKTILLFLLFVPILAEAFDQSYLINVLKSGKHFSSANYKAFGEVKNSNKLTSDEYLKAIFDSANQNIQSNYVVLKDLDFNIEIEKTEIIDSNSIQNPEQSSPNTFSHKEFLKCAERAILVLKDILFQKSLGNQDLAHELELTLEQERGLKDQVRGGIVCGTYLGKYGEIRIDGEIQLIKFLTFGLKETWDQTERLLKITKAIQNTSSDLEVKLLNYHFTKLMVHSFKGTDLKILTFDLAKNEFKDKYLNNVNVRVNEATQITINFKEAHAEVDAAFERMKNEIY